MAECLLMVELEALTKSCTKCGATKPLSQFYRQPSGVLGRYSWCSECTKANVKRLRAKRRAEMGEEAWKQHQRELVAKHRDQHGSDRSGASKAYRTALYELRDTHRAEFDERLRRIRYEMGLDL